MYRRAPISGLDNPSRASLATWASWAVSWLWLLTIRFLAVSPVALSSSRARSEKPFIPLPRTFRGGCALVPGVDTTALAAQPFPIQQTGAGELSADTGTTKALNGFCVELLGFLAIGHQRSRPASRPSAQSLAVAAAISERRHRHPLRPLGSDAHGGFYQLGQRPVRVDQVQGASGLWAAAKASSYRRRLLFSTALAHVATAKPISFFSV